MFYIVNDVAGTPQALNTEQGQAVQHQQLKLWGEWDPEYNHQQAAANDERYVSLRFQGQQYDPESGLHYNRHRYYDPQLKQYISPDPIGLAGGLRPQGYVINPLTWVDPLGLSEIIHNVDPKTLNFSQGYIEDKEHVASMVKQMRAGTFDWSRSPLDVQVIDGIIS